MPRLHEREKITNEAEMSLMRKLLDWQQEEGTEALTDAEFLQIVASELGGLITRHCKYMIRYERHGNEDKPGGWE